VPDSAAALAAEEVLTLDIQAILKALQHRYPMLLVDRIDRLEPGVYAEGVKCVTANEPYLVGHFPDHPIMPGVLIVDALAQAAGIMLRAGFSPQALRARREGGRTGVLAAIHRMRFLRPVVPGDQLRLQVRHLRTCGNAFQVKVDAFVGADLAATGELLLAS